LPATGPTHWFGSSKHSRLNRTEDRFVYRPGFAAGVGVRLRLAGDLDYRFADREPPALTTYN